MHRAWRTLISSVHSPSVRAFALALDSPAASSSSASSSSSPPSYVSIRQLASAYVSIRQHTSACSSSAHVRHLRPPLRRLRPTSAYVCVSIQQHTSAYVSIRQHTAAYVSIVVVCVLLFVASVLRQHTSAYGSIQQHTSAYVSIFSSASSPSSPPSYVMP
jgi:hypothetical protein